MCKPAMNDWSLRLFHTLSQYTVGQPSLQTGWVKRVSVTRADCSRQQRLSVNRLPGVSYWRHWPCGPHPAPLSLCCQQKEPGVTHRQARLLKRAEVTLPVHRHTTVTMQPLHTKTTAVPRLCSRHLACFNTTVTSLIKKTLQLCRRLCNHPIFACTSCGKMDTVSFPCATTSVSGGWPLRHRNDLWRVP